MIELWRLDANHFPIWRAHRRAFESEWAEKECWLRGNQNGMMFQPPLLSPPLHLRIATMHYIANAGLDDMQWNEIKPNVTYFRIECKQRHMYVVCAGIGILWNVCVYSVYT